jgi:hypothetical protein
MMCIILGCDPIYVFPEVKLHVLVPNFLIQVSVSDLYIPAIGPSIFCSKIGALQSVDAEQLVVKF